MFRKTVELWNHSVFCFEWTKMVEKSKKKQPNLLSARLKIFRHRMHFKCLMLKNRALIVAKIPKKPIKEAGHLRTTKVVVESMFLDV